LHVIESRESHLLDLTFQVEIIFGSFETQSSARQRKPHSGLSRNSKFEPSWPSAIYLPLRVDRHPGNGLRTVTRPLTDRILLSRQGHQVSLHSVDLTSLIDHRSGQPHDTVPSASHLFYADLDAYNKSQPHVPFPVTQVKMSTHVNNIMEQAPSLPPQLARQPSRQDLELAAQLIGHAQGRLEGAVSTSGSRSPGRRDERRGMSAESDTRPMPASDEDRRILQAIRRDVASSQDRRTSSPQASSSRDLHPDDQLLAQENGTPVGGQICR
jgi:hypothetical protein